MGCRPRLRSLSSIIAAPKGWRRNGRKSSVQAGADPVHGSAAAEEGSTGAPISPYPDPLVSVYNQALTGLQALGPARKLLTDLVEAMAHGCMYSARERGSDGLVWLQSVASSSY